MHAMRGGNVYDQGGASYEWSGLLGVRRGLLLYRQRFIRQHHMPAMLCRHLFHTDFGQCVFDLRGLHAGGIQPDHRCFCMFDVPARNLFDRLAGFFERYLLSLLGGPFFDCAGGSSALPLHSMRGRQVLNSDWFQLK